MWIKSVAFIIYVVRLWLLKRLEELQHNQSDNGINVINKCFLFPSLIHSPFAFFLSTIIWNYIKWWNYINVCFYKKLKSDIKYVTSFFFSYFYLWKLIQESLFNYNEKLSKRVLCSFAKHLQSSLWNYQWLEIFDPKLSALNHSTTDSLVF